MDALTRLGKRYRRYRHRNRFNRPVLIFIADTAIVLLKLGLLAVLLLAGLAVLNKPKLVKTTPVAETNSPIATEATMVATSDTATSDITPVKSAATEITTTTVTPVSTQIDSQSEFKKTVPATTHKTAVAPKDTSPGDLPLANISAQTIPTVITDEDWILGMQPSTYTIQFGASNDIALFETFIPVINSGDPISIYPYKLSPTGKPIYGIASGVYPSSATAAAAVESLPAEARAYEPWIRKAADLTLLIESVKTELQTQE